MPTDVGRREIAAWARVPPGAAKGGGHRHPNGTPSGTGPRAITGNGPGTGMPHLAGPIGPEPGRTRRMGPDGTAGHAMRGPAVRRDACGAAVPAVGTLRHLPDCGAKAAEE